MEDDVGLQKLMRRRGDRDGFEVIAAATGEEAIAIALTASPDVVVLDIHLPDQSGLRILARLKANPKTASIPIVVWSGMAPDDDVAEALRAGAVRFFEKTDLKPLMTYIAQLLDT